MDFSFSITLFTGFPQVLIQLEPIFLFFFNEVLFLKFVPVPEFERFN